MALPSQETYRWTKPEWRAEAKRWIRERVVALGYSIVGAVEQPHVRPWATAFTIPTTAGTLWFKASIPSLAYEVPLLQVLNGHRPDVVPRIVAADVARGWMLVEDAGTQVSELYDGRPPIGAWTAFLGEYAQLQLDVAPFVDDLVACGVPDRRRDLVGDFFAVVEDDRCVREPTHAALDDGELARLRALEPRLRAAAASVRALGLPDTIHHDDLHAWNVCVRDGRHRFIDWGDSSLAQPLLSLRVPLVRLDDTSASAAERVRDAYLEPWTALCSLRELREASGAAVLLGELSGVLKWHVLYTSLPHDERTGYDDVIQVRLRALLEVACA